MKGERKYRLLKNVIFFLNVLIAVMIILGGRMLAQTDFGKAALSFGFVMIAISTLMKIVQKW